MVGIGELTHFQGQRRGEGGGVKMIQPSIEAGAIALTCAFTSLGVYYNKEGGSGGGA